LQAQQLAVGEQRRQFDRSLQLLMPRIRGGDKAFQEMSDLMGLGDIGIDPNAYNQGGSNGLSGATGQFGQYTSQNPDLQQAFNGLSQRDQRYIAQQGFDGNGDGRIDQGEFGQFHYNRYGGQEGRQLPGVDNPSIGGLEGHGPVDGGQTRSDRQDAAYQRFRTSPGYRFRLQEGIDSLDSSAASRGMLLSGNQLKEVNNYAQGQASQEYGNYYNRLAALAGAGQTSTGQAVQTGQAVANNIGSAAIGGGRDRASAYQNQGENSANLYNSLGGIATDFIGSRFGPRPGG